MLANEIHHAHLPMTDILDNIVWHTLSGPHARFAQGSAMARRYVAGFPTVVAFADRETPDFAGLAPFVQTGEHLYCDGWQGPAPPSWQIEAEAVLLKLCWDADAPLADPVQEAMVLDARHAAQAWQLAKLSNLRPFTSRSLELGLTLGIFDAGRLIAMAGSRICAGGYAEISSVCTHPDFQGRGLAHGLVSELLRRQTQGKLKSFLRVMQAHENTLRLYRRMGFRDYGVSLARVVSRR
ncbi:GNAT family N-acetyltransferase [Undibacterium sp. TJN19]|uniref:GNAT family N-acetyltransferase n=1 Tax=Undibacterium sp. TJN19 TaxID=3413055 RepID=UPI003BF42C60